MNRRAAPRSKVLVAFVSMLLTLLCAGMIVGIVYGVSALVGAGSPGAPQALPYFPDNPPPYPTDTVDATAAPPDLPETDRDADTAQDSIDTPDVGAVLPEAITAVDNTLLPWYLVLVNRYNALSDDFSVRLADVGDGHLFDARAADALEEMLQAARAQGLSPVIISSYRSVARQRTLFTNRVNSFIIEDGMSAEEADYQARRRVAYPGTSEHNLGLAVDIVSASYHGLTDAQANTPEGIWLAENSWRFGFVVRYPNHKQHITHIIFEPWHFRYVGLQAAEYMHTNDLVLEEYVYTRLLALP